MWGSGIMLQPAHGSPLRVRPERFISMMVEHVRRSFSPRRLFVYAVSMAVLTLVYLIQPRFDGFTLASAPSVAVGFAFVLALVYAVLAIRGKGRTRRVLILGTGARASRAWRELRIHGHKSAHVVGFVDDRSLEEMAPDIANRFVSSAADLPAFLLDNSVDEIVIAVPLRSCYDMAERVVAVAEAAGLHVSCLNDPLPKAAARRRRGFTSIIQDLARNPRDVGISDVGMRRADGGAAHVSKTAVVHDYFVQMGGAERVAEELYRLDTAATVFATVALEDRLPGALKGVPVRTSWLQHLPSLRKIYRLYFLLYPLGVDALDLSEFNCILSSSSGYAKGVRTAPHAVHICYCHTPMRWVWSYDTYSAREGMGQAARSLIRRAISGLRNWDLYASRQPDHFIANSRAVAERIQRCYGRFSEVIYPPIDVDRFAPGDRQGDFYLVLSRLIPYKRIDLAIQACNMLGKKLVIVGSGPQMAALKKIAGPTIEFAGRLSDEDVARVASECKALLFPGEEDFGMAPLEIAAAGRPTIAYAAGGALETVVDGLTGVFFQEQEPESLADAIVRFEGQTWSQSVLRAHSEQFSVPVFQARMRAFMKKVGVHSEDRYRSLVEELRQAGSAGMEHHTSRRTPLASPALPLYSVSAVQPSAAGVMSFKQEDRKARVVN